MVAEKKGKSNKGFIFLYNTFGKTERHAIILIKERRKNNEQKNKKKRCCKSSEKYKL